MASASASVIYVDLSSDSEDEQSPPGPKRRRLEQLQQKSAGTGVAQAFRKTLPNKLVNIQKASLPGVGGTLPSGLTVTKHTNNNSINKTPCNGRAIVLPGGGTQHQISASHNISNIKKITNNNAIKQVNPVPSQNIAWSMAHKAPSPNVMLPSIPRHQVKVTPVMKSFGKPNLPATTTPSPIKFTSLPAVKLQKTLVVNKLPTLQNSHLAPLQRCLQTPQPQSTQPTSAQHIQKQQKAPAPILSKSQPATSVRNINQGPNLSLSKTATLNRVGTGLAHAANFTTKSLASVRAGPPINTTNVMSTAARTIPFRSASLVHQTAPSLVTSMAASATPPLRLLATPPHSAAALNEPLLLNLPPTTSITPQLTPTTTPPPMQGLSIYAMNQQKQLSKGSTFKLSALPSASLSPVSVTVSKAKRIQPITVLKKSDEEWRKHVIGQQQQKLSKDQPLSTPPTIVLVESPPTTPPTEKPESERAREKTTTPTAGTATASQKPTINKPKMMSAITTNLVKTTTMKKQPANLEKKIIKNEEQKIVNLVDPIEKEQVKPELRKEQPKQNDPQSNMNIKSPPQPTPLIPEYADLLQLCRETDKSSDMERLIDIKLIKYYNNVHEKFVKSRGFRKMVQSTIENIKDDPEMIYLHLKGVVDELRVRRKGRTMAAIEEKQEDNTITKEQSIQPLAPTNDETSLGDKCLDERVRKLSRTLYTITKRITALEEADVDWNDDDDSSYLQVERFKKRACQIYEKICDLTGENKSAQCQLKQPFVFKDTPYPQFNRTLSSFVNRMQEFPDYHDVLRLLEHCNKEKDLGLANFEMKRIAHDAFVKVGRLLQARRKTDLYETVTHFTANAKDPAAADPELLAKLNENHKKQTKISDVLAKYAREQDLTAEEHREARLKEKLAKAAQKSTSEESITKTHPSQDDDDDDDKPCTSAQARAKALNGFLKKMQLEEAKVQTGEHEEEEDEDTTSDDSEDEEDVDAFVDNFKANGEVSDAESEAEDDRPGLSEPKTKADVIDDRTTRVKTDAVAVPTKEELESMPNGKLKIMSVSSLNASLHQTKTKVTEKKPQERVPAEIIISDEES